MTKEQIRQNVVKIIKMTTHDVTCIMNRISEAFETKQYHLILHQLDQMKQVISAHRVKIDLICIHWNSQLDQKTIIEYKQGNEMLVEKFQLVHENIMKDVVSCFNLDGNEFH